MHILYTNILQRRDECRPNIVQGTKWRYPIRRRSFFKPIYTPLTPAHTLNYASSSVYPLSVQLRYSTATVNLLLSNAFSAFSPFALAYNNVFPIPFKSHTYIYTSAKSTIGSKQEFWLLGCDAILCERLQTFRKIVVPSLLKISCPLKMKETRPFEMSAVLSNISVTPSDRAADNPTTECCTVLHSDTRGSQKVLGNPLLTENER